MFGFGLFKLLIIAAVVAAVWLAFKRFTGSGGERGGRRPVEGNERESRESIDAQDMVACPVCGNYVAGNGATSCGRGDCPYPK